ncbi:hypothetical protein [Mesorhizobium sp. L103C105A0]|uniref:hypothetical protein n=1 Tax=Mesorhizobium sp. L103C105A0 TaxID=1287074 RepID=UPI001FD8FD79|nr:hypothetical protein [Mesorhizobium sp. L103C105A0]
MHNHLALKAHSLTLDIGASLFPLSECRFVPEFDSDLVQDRQRSLVNALKLLSSDDLDRPDAVLDGRDARPSFRLSGSNHRRASSAAPDCGSISIHLASPAAE